MSKFVRVQIFTDDIHAEVDDIFINPNHIVGIREKKYTNYGIFTNNYTIFLTSDGNQFESPMDIIKFQELIS